MAKRKTRKGQATICKILLASLGYEICLSGDFNGRCVRKCDFTGNTILSVGKQSYNGGRLRQFIEATELTVVNSLVCCEGLFTRILNDQRSTIDYVLLSKQLANNVRSVCIDEDGQYRKKDYQLGPCLLRHLGNKQFLWQSLLHLSDLISRNVIGNHRSIIEDGQQYNGQKKNEKRASDDLQNTT
jgi:hypothetical protein